MRAELRAAWDRVVAATAPHMASAREWGVGIGPDFRQSGEKFPEAIAKGMELLGATLAALMRLASEEPENPNTLRILDHLLPLLHALTGEGHEGEVAVKTSWAGQGEPTWHTDTRGEIPLPNAHLWVVVVAPMGPQPEGGVGYLAVLFLAFFCPRSVAAAWWSLLSEATGWPVLASARTDEEA